MKYIDVKNLKPGQEIITKVVVQLTTYGYITAYDFLAEGAILIGETEVTVTVPEDFNPVAEAVKAVDRQIDKLHDEHREKLKPLQAKKDQLLQLSYQGQEILDKESP